MDDYFILEYKKNILECSSSKPKKKSQNTIVPKKPMNLELPFPGRLSIKAPEKLIRDEERLKDPLKDR